MVYVFIIFDFCYGIYCCVVLCLWLNDFLLVCIFFIIGEEGVVDINFICIWYVCYCCVISLCRVDS